MQGKQQQTENRERTESAVVEMCRARLPGKDRRAQRKRLEHAPLRDWVRNPLRRNRSDY